MDKKKVRSRFFHLQRFFFHLQCASERRRSSGNVGRCRGDGRDC